MALGNFVFMDNNADGVFNSGDMALANVRIELYTAAQAPGSDTPLAFDVTDPSGYYYFDQLNAGQYRVYIPAVNFTAGQPLENKASYPGADAGDTDNNDTAWTCWSAAVSHQV